MSNAENQLRAQITAALEAPGAREHLLQELEGLSRDPGFGDCAEVWAPALYRRDAHFFAPFLLDHLHRDQEDVIRSLLPRLEADGDDGLFHRLYRRIIDEASWNQDLSTLATSSLSDAEVLRALDRRRVTRERGFDLSEETALQLYRRNPKEFAPFLLAQIRGGWGENRPHYAALCAAARQHGDDEFYWSLFRRIATPAEWAESVRALLHQHPAAHAVADELDRRHPEFIEELDGGVLAAVLDDYGAAAAPYIEQHVTLVTRKGAARLLDSAEKLGDDALYWRIFFKAGKRATWDKSLLALTRETLTDEAFRQALLRRTPPLSQQGGWSVSPSVALALYQRAPGLARPFLARWLEEVDNALFAAAEQAGDEDLLDILSAHLIKQLGLRISAVFLTKSELTYRKPDAHAHAELEAWQRTISARFDRLVAQSPSTYATHAARILGMVEIGEEWSFKRNAEHNPVFSYLYYRHRAAWLTSPTALRDLLESPLRPVQLVALAALAEGGADAAARIVENLPLLASFLLDDAARSTKKLVLAALERAAREHAETATQILPLLEEASNFHALASIDERILVSAVRLRHQYGAQQEAATLAPHSSGIAGTR
jgi:hypothetical protein